MVLTSSLGELKPQIQDNVKMLACKQTSIPI